MKISREVKEKLKSEILEDIKPYLDKVESEVRQQIESKKSRFDQVEIESIISVIKESFTTQKLDESGIVKELLSEIKTSDEEKRLDFYQKEIFSPKNKKEIAKIVLDQIELPKDGEKGERGEKGEQGPGYTLTDKDKQEIANFIDLSGLRKERAQELAVLVEKLKNGQIRIPRGAGIVTKEIVSEFDKYLGTTDWQRGLPSNGDIPLNVPYINFTKGATGVPDEEGIVSWNDNEKTININTGLGTIIQAGQETVVIVCNNSGVDIANGEPTYVTGSYLGCPTVAVANASSHETIFGAVGLATTDIPDGSFGFVADFGAVRGVDASYLAQNVPIYVAAWTGTEKKLTDVRPSFPNYAIQVGQVTVKDATNGVIALKIDQNANDTFVNFWNGTIRESFDFLVTSNGTEITGALSPSNGHPNLTMVFSDGLTTLETTPPKTITLTAGSDAVPQLNYVYIPKSTKVLTVSTDSWPTAEHIRIASVFLRSASRTQSDGALKNHNFNDHVQSTTTNQGHLSHIGERIRRLDAKWDEGVEASLSGTPTNVYVSTTAGYVYQLHRQVFPAQSMPTNDIHVVNNPSSAYLTVTNLNGQTLDSGNVALSNRSFSFVIWGVQNKTGEMCHLMCNLPSGSYARLSPALAVEDASNYSDYSIPKQFQGTGFLIARFTFQLDAGGTQWTLYHTDDLRGFLPNTTAGSGGGGGGVTSFLGLSDTPSAYTSQAGRILRVNSGETALDFTSVIKLNGLKTGTLAAPPSGLVIDEVWKDTTDSVVHPRIRISTVAT